VRRLLCVAIALAACRPNPGTSNYDAQETFPFDGGSDGGLLPGPDPFIPGHRRLTVGAFYETGRSDSIPIDNSTTHLYVYMETATLESDFMDYIEGSMSNRILLTGMTWWGFGIHWDTTRDMSVWKTMHVSFKSNDDAYATFNIAMNNGMGATMSKSVTVDATKYGYKNDGSWHTLAVPVADFVANGLDITQVSAPFVLGGGLGPGGATMRVDDLYFSAD
jgi:hypothetical protein